MTLRILGAGFGRTGTLSLKHALEELGLGACYHMLEVAQHNEHAKIWAAVARGERIDWERILADYSAAVDWPAAAFWRELVTSYPDARVILTVRESSDWYASFRNTILANLQGPSPPERFKIRAVYDLSRDIILARTFGGRADDMNHSIDVFNEHNRAITEAIDPQRLLVYDVATGWDPLCGFLGLRAPEKPFPHLNKRSSFRRQYANLAKGPDQSRMP